jgi:hypothetical protein
LSDAHAVAQDKKAKQNVSHGLGLGLYFEKVKGLPTRSKLSLREEKRKGRNIGWKHGLFSLHVFTVSTKTDHNVLLQKSVLVFSVGHPSPNF